VNQPQVPGQSVPDLAREPDEAAPAAQYTDDDHREETDTVPLNEAVLVPSSTLPSVSSEPEPLNIRQIFEDRRFEAELLQLIAERVDPPPSWNRGAGNRDSRLELLEGEDNTETNPPSYRPLPSSR
jgi:hypothetical protein